MYFKYLNFRFIVVRIKCLFFANHWFTFNFSQWKGNMKLIERNAEDEYYHRRILTRAGSIISEGLLAHFLSTRKIDFWTKREGWHLISQMALGWEQLQMQDISCTPLKVYSNKKEKIWSIDWWNVTFYKTPWIYLLKISLGNLKYLFTGSL